MHIPKTAGTSLAAALAAALLPRSDVSGFDACTFGGWRDTASLAPAIRSKVHMDPAAIPRGADMIAGHFALSTLRKTYPDAMTLTFLREPWSRLLSHWAFWRMHEDAMLAPWGSWAEVVTLSRQPLRAFLSDPRAACQTDNLAARLMLWPHPLIPDAGFIDPRHDALLLSEARARLAAIHHADVVENKGLETALAARLGCALAVPRKQVTPRLPEPYRTDLTRELADAADRLDACSRLDLALWGDVAAARMQCTDTHTLRDETRSRAVRRYTELAGV